jgi:hypothetical protein
MSLSAKLQKLMDSTVAEFCRRLADQHEGLDVEALMEVWKDTAKKPKALKKPRKVTAYMIFSQTVRADMKAENPEMTFGEISQETSRRWKAMTDEEKAQYAPTPLPTEVEDDGYASTPSPVLVPSSPASTNDEDKTTQKKKGIKKAKKVGSPKVGSPKVGSPKVGSPKAGPPPKKATVADLKKQCKDKGLNVKGLKKREEFEALLATLLETCASSSSSTIMEEGESSPVAYDEEEEAMLA